MSSTTAEAHHDDLAHSHELPWPQQLRANRLGLWLFVFQKFSCFWDCWLHDSICGVASGRN